jgi:DNA-binding response OmpR family regulator
MTATCGRFLSKAFREDGYGLDVMLPGRGGFDIVTELRSRSVFTPVLMPTAKDELESG